MISGLIAALCLLGTAIDAFQLMMKEDELEEDTIEILNDGADDDNAFVKGNAFSYGQQQQQQQQQISMHTVNVDSSSRFIKARFPLHRVLFSQTNDKILKYDWSRLSLVQNSSGNLAEKIHPKTRYNIYKKTRFNPFVFSFTQITKLWNSFCVFR